MRRVVIAFVCLLGAACGGKDSSNPASPSTPAAPTAMTLSFSGTWPADRVDSLAVTGNGNALGLVWPGRGFSSTDGKDAGAIWIGVKATGSNVGQVRGDIKWDPKLVSLDSYSNGEWFEQGGALVTYGLLRGTSGQVTLQLDRPSTLGGATGTGDTVFLRFRGLARGTTPLQWSNPELRGVDFSARPLTGGSYGGTITIQ